MISTSLPLRFNSKIVALSTILLMLWFNVAVIEHQLDVSPSHHSEHNCQLFACANLGLAQSLPTLPVWISYNYLQPVTLRMNLSVLYLAYLARSPPLHNAL